MSIIANANWLAKAQEASPAIVATVELLGLNLMFASQPYHEGRRRYFGDGLLFGAGVTFGATWPAFDTRLSAQALQGLTLGYDIRDGGGIIYQASISFPNDLALHTILTAQNLIHTPIRVRLLFREIGVLDALSLFFGHVDSVRATTNAITIVAIPNAFRVHRDLNYRLGEQYFPGTPDTLRGRQIPQHYGVLIDVEPLQISGEVIGTLAEDIGTTDTIILINEPGAAFPDSGTMTLGGTELGATYTTREVFSINNVTYVQISGITRGAPLSSHSAGDEVELTSVSYKYLIGDAIDTLVQVRDTNGVVPGAQYTFVQEDSGGPFPVSTLAFTTARTDVRVDFIAGAVEPLGSVANGDFETGDLTSWTQVNLTTGGVTSTTPYEGAFSAELEGQAASWGLIRQDITVTPGRQSTLIFAYRDQDEALTGNLLSNGDFSNGDLSNWTVTLLTTNTKHEIIDQPGYNPDNEKLLRVYSEDCGLTGVVIPTCVYGLSMYQDITVTASVAYECSFLGPTDIIDRTLLPTTTPEVTASAPGTPQYIGAGGQPTSFPFGSIRREVKILLGTPTVPDAYNTIAAGISLNPVQFTPTSTTLRVTWEITASSSAGLPPPSTLRYISIILATNVSRSVSGIRVGTTSDSTEYVDQQLPFQNIWTPQAFVFEPIGTIARVELMAGFTNAAIAVANNYDDVRVLDAGLNPIDIIRDYIDTNIPGLKINETAFQSAYGLRREWRFTGSLRRQQDTATEVRRLARQAGCRYFEDREGRATLVPFTLVDVSPVYGFGPPNVVANSLGWETATTDAVYTEFYVYYGVQSGDGTAIEHYQNVVFATPEESNANTAFSFGLSDTLASLFRITRRRNRFNMLAYMVADKTTAELLLRTLIDDLTFLGATVTWRSDLTASAIELGSWVTLFHPMLTYNAVRASTIELTRITTMPTAGMTELSGRAMLTPGYADDFEILVPPTQGLGIFDNFEP